MQGLFKNTAGQFLRLAVFASVSILLTYIDYRDDTLRGFRSALGTAIVEPTKFIATLPYNIIQSARGISTSRETLQANLDNLGVRNQRLQTELLTLEGLKAENTRLRELLNSSEKTGTESTVAEIITIDLDPFKQLITLNKGSSDNVVAGQAIVDAYGVMGQIIHTTNNTATTLLVSDPAHSLPVQVQRNGFRTLANGTGHADELNLMHIPSNADIKVGDIIITSGLGGIFPKNYPVGTVKDIQSEVGRPFLKVIAASTAQLNRSREVLILKSVNKDNEKQTNGTNQENQKP